MLGLQLVGLHLVLSGTTKTGDTKYNIVWLFCCFKKQRYSFFLSFMLTPISQWFFLTRCLE